MSKILEWSPVFPESMVVEILLRQPVKPLFRFKCVSKSWNDMISEPSFEKNRNDLASETHNLDNLIVKSTYPPKMELFSDQELAEIGFVGERVDELNLVGSCNGVVCFATLPAQHRIFGGFRLILWNPSTTKTFTVPQNPHPGKSDQLRFCFNPETPGEFKIVNVVDSSSVHVYNLSTNSWSDAGRTFPERITSSENAKQAVVNGCAHWYGEEHDGIGIILAFDPRNNRFKKIALPPTLTLAGYSRTTAANLGGSLAVIAENGDQDFELWVMRQYGVVESWTKMFVGQRPLRGSCCYFKCVWKNRVVFLLDREEQDGESRPRLAWYDPKKKRFETILVVDSVNFDVISYTESMVSVESPVPNPISVADSDPEIPTGTDWYVAGLTNMGVYY